MESGKRGPVDDLSKETRVDWDREIAAGHVQRVEHDNREGTHLRGKQLSSADLASRSITLEEADHIAKTGRRLVRKNEPITEARRGRGGGRRCFGGWGPGKKG